MQFEILTIRIKLTKQDGQVLEDRSTAQRDDLQWVAQQFAEVNNAKLVEIYHNNELVAQYPEK